MNQPTRERLGAALGHLYAGTNGLATLAEDDDADLLGSERRALKTGLEALKAAADPIALLLEHGQKRAPSRGKVLPPPPAPDPGPEPATEPPAAEPAPVPVVVPPIDPGLSAALRALGLAVRDHAMACRDLADAHRETAATAAAAALSPLPVALPPEPPAAAPGRPIEPPAPAAPEPPAPAPAPPAPATEHAPELPAVASPEEPRRRDRRPLPGYRSGWVAAALGISRATMQSRLQRLGPLQVGLQFEGWEVVHVSVGPGGRPRLRWQKRDSALTEANAAA